MDQWVYSYLLELKTLWEKEKNCSLRAISPFPTMFSKAIYCFCVKMSIYGEKRLTQVPVLTTPKEIAFENIEGKEENASYQHFLS